MSKKKKKLKAHIFHATHQAQQQASTNSFEKTSDSTISSSTATTFFSTPEDKSHKYERQFGHVLPDLKFFGLMVVMMVVILGAIYYFDQSNGLVLKLGDQVYKILHLS